MREEKVFIPSQGFQLEGLLSNQEAFSVRGGAILCHPHPQYGGDMHSLVISTAVDAAYQEGYTTLRFNFRGVGRSGGSYSEGIGEREDVRAAIDYLCSAFGHTDLPLVLLGYSFGAWAALPVGVEDRRVKAMVGIAPPLELYDFDFLEGSKKKKLLVAGDQDFFCPMDALKSYFERLDQPKSLAIIEGADHFFFTHHRALVEPLREFLGSL
ncbi:MAG: alpha/beta hydrolase [Thermodesulfobacteriota bacterium]